MIHSRNNHVDLVATAAGHRAVAAAIKASLATGGAKAAPTREKEVKDKGTVEEPATGGAAQSAEVPVGAIPAAVAEEEEDPDADL